MRGLFRTGFAPVAVLALLVACRGASVSSMADVGEGGGADGGTATGPDDSSTDAAGGSSTVESGGGATPSGKSITAAAGGTVTAAGVVVEIPAGALTADTTITVAVSDGAGLPAAAMLVSKVYDLGPNGTQFSKPVKVTLGIDAAKLGAHSATVAYLAGGKWIDLSDSAVTGGSVTATTTHFTQFGVFGGPHVTCTSYRECGVGELCNTDKGGVCESCGLQVFSAVRCNSAQECSPRAQPSLCGATGCRCSNGVNCVGSCAPCLESDGCATVPHGGRCNLGSQCFEDRSCQLCLDGNCPTSCGAFLGDSTRCLGICWGGP
jgi:hypothetical protein